MDAAKEGVRHKIEEYVKAKGLPAAVDHVLRALAKCGVKEEAVLAKCNVADRKGIGVELKPTYYRQAVRNVKAALDADSQRALELSAS